MKKYHILPILSIFLFGAAGAQIDSLQTDSTVVQEPEIKDDNTKSSKNQVSDFKIYGGLSVSTILLSGSDAESAYSSGYALGASYRRGKYFYWEIGANYNGSVVGFEDVLKTEKTLEFRQFNFPVTVGLNLLGQTGRILGIRAFGGAVPGVITKVLVNPFELSKDDFNEFQMSGRLGVGVDVLFLFVELDYTYGFTDILQDRGSNLSQVNFLLGFRF